tara:strand:- start:980 stop:2281 length:1302 start_codon:yes stop_codon:yes gene_type:complete
MLTLFLNKNFKIISFLLILGIIFYRSPHILLNGRFVVEEGSYWFRNSYLFGPIAGLTQINWESSYFHLWPNIASVFATFVPLEYSPLVTVYFALIVKLYLFLFIIFGQSNFIKSDIDKFFLSFIVLLSPPMVAEVWLNTLVSQVYFTIICIFILFQKNIKGDLFNKTSPFILLISGLSSLLPCLLTPFFLFNLVKEKDKLRLYNFVAIFLCSIFQSFIFIVSYLQNLANTAGQSERFIISIEKLFNFIYNVLAKPLFGRDLTQFVYYNIFDQLSIFIIIIFFTLLISLIFIFIFKYLKKDKILSILVILFFLYSLLALYGSKVEQVQGRFALLPGILLLFSIYRIFQISNKSLKYLCIFLVTTSLLAGSYEFKKNNKYPQLLICLDCPDWKEEVEKWKKDNTYKLKIWDYPTRSMSLHGDNWSFPGGRPLTIF